MRVVPRVHRNQRRFMFIRPGMQRSIPGLSAFWADVERRAKRIQGNGHM